MEPSVIVALIGAALAVLVARGMLREPERQPVPVRVDDDVETTRR